MAPSPSKGSKVVKNSLDEGDKTVAAAQSICGATHWVGAPRAILCAGLKGSASTWVFNVVIEILNRTHADQGKAAPKILRMYSNDLSDLPLEADGADYLVIKSHAPSPSLARYLSIAHAPVILSARDPRDCVTALMQRLGVGYDSALAEVVGSAASLAALRKNKNALVLCFEDRFFDYPRVVKDIADFLGCKLSGLAIKAIFESLTRERVRQKIETLEKEGAFGSAASLENFDPQTHWHLNHVGDAASGKYASALGQEEQASIAYEMHEFCSAFNYDLSSLKASTPLVAPLFDPADDNQRANALMDFSRAALSRAWPKTALRSLKHAMVIKSRDHWLYDLSAEINEALGNFSEAESDIRIALGFSQSTPSHFMRLSHILKKRKLYAEAREALECALQLKTDDAWIYHHLANLEIEEGNWPAAREAMEKAVSLAPQISHHLVKRARVLRELEEFVPANSMLQQALREEPKAAWIHFHLAHLMVAWGKLDEGLLSAEQALELDKGNPEYLNFVNVIRDRIIKTA